MRQNGLPAFNVRADLLEDVLHVQIQRFHKGGCGLLILQPRLALGTNALVDVVCTVVEAGLLAFGGRVRVVPLLRCSGLRVRDAQSIVDI